MTSENRPQSLFSVAVSANIVSTKFTWGHLLCHDLLTCQDQISSYWLVLWVASILLCNREKLWISGVVLVQG